jgi:hypothetical protein
MLGSNHNKLVHSRQVVCTKLGLRGGLSAAWNSYLWPCRFFTLAAVSTISATENPAQVLVRKHRHFRVNSNSREGAEKYSCQRTATIEDELATLILVHG